MSDAACIFLSMSTSFIALLTAVVPGVLGLVGRLLLSESRPLRSIKRHTQLLKDLPSAAKGPLENLIVDETRRYADRALDRSRRRLNSSNLAALILVALFTGSLIYWGVELALLASPWWWIPTVPIGFFLIGVTATGFGKNFWTYPDDEAASSG